MRKMGRKFKRPNLGYKDFLDFTGSKIIVPNDHLKDVQQVDRKLPLKPSVKECIDMPVVRIKTAFSTKHRIISERNTRRSFAPENQLFVYCTPIHMTLLR